MEASALANDAPPPGPVPLVADVLRRARSATAAVLLALGLLIGSWAPRIPDVKAELGLSDGQLGLGLLGAPVGAVATMWLTGLMVARFGSRRVVRFGLLLYCLTGPVIGHAAGVATLFVFLLAWGASGAILDISVNAQAVEVERGYARSIMASMHAAWTGGALAGAGIGALSAAFGVSLFWQLAVLGAITFAVTLPLTRAMIDDGHPAPTLTLVPSESASLLAPTTAPAPAPAAALAAYPAADPATDPAADPKTVPVSGRTFAALAALSAIATASFFSEGASADWSAVYLTDVTGASAGVAGAGFVAFTAVMLVARLLGDRLVVAFGAARVVRVLAGTASGAFALALALGGTGIGTAAGIAGFAFLGGGLACIVPVAISAAGRVGTDPGKSVAIVITSGYVGWLAGPPLVGGLAELFGLHSAMTVLPVLAALVALFASVLADSEA